MLYAISLPGVLLYRTFCQRVYIKSIACMRFIMLVVFTMRSMDSAGLGAFGTRYGHDSNRREDAKRPRQQWPGPVGCRCSMQVALDLHRAIHLLIVKPVLSVQAVVVRGRKPLDIGDVRPADAPMPGACGSGRGRRRPLSGRSRRPRGARRSSGTPRSCRCGR